MMACLFWDKIGKNLIIPENKLSGVNKKRGIEVKYMLETSEERVKLLKSGIEARTIERLFIEKNNIRIIHHPILFEMHK